MSHLAIITGIIILVPHLICQATATYLKIEGYFIPSSEQQTPNKD